MSKVTNLILTCSLGEKEDYLILKLSEFNSNKIPFNIVSIDDDCLPRGWYGGTKYFESNVFIGAYNYLDIKELISFLKLIKWEDPEDVQLLIKDYDDEKFKLIDLFDS